MNNLDQYSSVRIGELSNNVTFTPWVGENYFSKNRFGCKILLLGESHYAKFDGSISMREFTRYVVNELVYEKEHQFFTKLSKCLLNMDTSEYLTKDLKCDVWKDVSFYNYIQVFVGHVARIRPTDNMWNAAIEPLNEVLKLLAPDVVIIIGKQLARKVNILDNNIETCTIEHPASPGFSYARNNQPVQISIYNSRSGILNAKS